MSIVSGVGASPSVGSTSGGKTYGYSTLTTLVQVAPANQQRRKITFHNPGPVDILVSMTQYLASVAATTLSTFTPTTSAYGGCYRIFANGGTLEVEGECQLAWQALTVDASAGQLTVVDTNV